MGTEDLSMDTATPPTIDQIKSTRMRLGDMVRETPVWQWRSEAITDALGDTSVFLKMELFQYAGSFKARGALTSMLSMGPAELTRGVTTVSAGNHAMACAYAARVLGTTAKVVMPKNANPFRVQCSRDLGAEVVLVDDVHIAFDTVDEIQKEEGRVFVHPFEGPSIALGTATLGMELCRQVQDLDAVIVPIGGGGLCSGVSAAIKMLSPRTVIYGVEPEGADTMHRSFASGKPECIDKVRTIADSLGAPHAAPYSLSLCKQFVDELVLVDDSALCDAMRLLFRDMKLAVEPACAASTAALLGPLRDRIRGQRVALILCGTNIDLESFARYTAAVV